MTSGLSKEVVSDEGNVVIYREHIQCDQQSQSYKRGSPSKGVLLYIRT